MMVVLSIHLCRLNEGIAHIIDSFTPIIRKLTATGVSIVVRRITVLLNVTSLECGPAARRSWQTKTPGISPHMGRTLDMVNMLDFMVLVR
jgi:hypothetical protein